MATCVERPVVLVLLGALWPGHDSTGPNQSLRSLAQGLGQDFKFKVVARDRPFGAAKPLAPAGTWEDRGWAHFTYCKVGPRGARGLGHILRETPHDLLMMNGFFDREFTLPALVLRRLGLVPAKPAILSTRGEFARGALGLKSARKATWLAVARTTGLLRDVWLHATGPREAEDIARGFPYSQGVQVAPNLRVLGAAPPAPRPRVPGAPLRLAFLGRIARVKNLDYALSALAHVHAPASFDIYGPVQDAEHWAQCQAIIATLPTYIKVEHKGEIANEEVAAHMARYDLLFLPTRGENFGHAILDALCVGVPVLISDQTPFQNLQSVNAGWSLPLSKPAAFSAAIDTLAGATADQRLALHEGARALAERMIGESDAFARNRAMLNAAIGARRP